MLVPTISVPLIPNHGQVFTLSPLSVFTLYPNKAKCRTLSQIYMCSLDTQTQQSFHFCRHYQFSIDTQIQPSVYLVPTISVKLIPKHSQVFTLSPLSVFTWYPNTVKCSPCPHYMCLVDTQTQPSVFHDPTICVHLIPKYSQVFALFPLSVFTWYSITTKF